MGATQSGIELFKIWINVGDSRVRDSHSEMDDYPPIKLDEAFQVGNSLMQYPGDPNGGIQETIRCRCTLDYINQ